MSEPQSLAAIQAAPIKWLWRNWLPRGAVTLYDGNPGEAKSTLVVDLAARLTTGRAWPDGQLNGKPGRVLYVTREDDSDHTILPRLLVADGDANLVDFHPAVTMPEDEEWLRCAIEQNRYQLVFLDPLFGNVASDVRTISDVDMRARVMAPLHAVARDTEAAILATRHNSKDTSASPLNRGAGSLGGLAGAARMVLASRSDPDDDHGRLFGVVKSNYGPSGLTLKYHVEARSPDGWSAEDTVSGIVWDGLADLSIEQVSAEEDHETARDAGEALRGILRGRVTVPSEEVARRMKQLGYGKAATRSARSRIGAVLRKDGMEGGWVVYLPSVEGIVR